LLKASFDAFVIEDPQICLKYPNKKPVYISWILQLSRKQGKKALVNTALS